MPRVLAITPLFFRGNESDFLDRDTGLLGAGVRQHGWEFRHFCLGREDSPKINPSLPLEAVKPESLRDPAWWRDQKGDLAYLLGWGSPKWDGIRSAIREARLPLIERLDTDGIRSPRVDFRDVVWYNWSNHCSSKRWLRRHFPGAVAFVRGVTVLAFPGILDLKLAKSMSTPDILTAESPLSVQRIRRFLRAMGFSDKNTTLLPGPIVPETADIPEAGARENRIVAIGRWNVHQKNFPMLLETIELFLGSHPQWKAEIFGAIPTSAGRLVSSLSHDVRSRVDFRGRVANEVLMGALRAAKIEFLTSRHESFHNSSAEALLRGCSIVGPPQIPSIGWFCQAASGTVATAYSAAHIADALSAEAKAWQDGERDPGAISRYWHARISSTAVAAKLIELVGPFVQPAVPKN